MKIITAIVICLFMFIGATPTLNDNEGCVTSRGKPGRCVTAATCKALIHDQEALSTRSFFALHKGGCPSRSFGEQSVCCPLHSPIKQLPISVRPKWPPPGPVTNLDIASGTSSILLRWDDPLNIASGTDIEAFRVIWKSKGEVIKNRVIEASNLFNLERRMIIRDVTPDTEYTIAVEAKIKSEEEFSVPIIRKVKTLSNSGDSRIFYLGEQRATEE